MNVKFVSSISFVPCQSPFLSTLQDKNVLPQVQQLDRLVNEYGTGLVKLIVNDQYCSLSQLRKDIVAASQRACQYLYLAINKFFVYSTVDTTFITEEYDLRLIKYCQHTIDNDFTLLQYTIRPDDNGTLGNFLHPVTTMFFKRND